MLIHPDTLDVRLDRNLHRDSTRLSWRSRRYDLHYELELRDRWGDPRPLVEFVQRFVGGTFAAWEHAGIDNGREMAQALMPHFEAEIHRFMERLEREGRRRDPRIYYGGGRRPDYWYDDFNPGTWSPVVEDPKAKQKARQLLMRNLDAGQLKSFEKDGWFKVTAKDGKVYTVSTARSFNVKAEDGTKYCGQLADTPVEDQMLAQKLLLEHEPDKFFKNANVSPAITVGSDVGFIQSGTAAVTATEIRLRMDDLRDRLPWV